MYECLDCSQEFAYPDVDDEGYKVCPNCGSDCFIEM